VKEVWDNLITLLSEMVNVYKSILEISRQKNKSLIAAKTQEIEKLTREEEMLILHAGKLEGARIKLMQELAARYGVAGETLTLARLREIAEPDTAKKLETIAGEFDTTLQELAPINSLNTELIQQALRYINFNINILTKSSASNTYAPQGQAEPGTSLRLVDRKI
jgi:flagellar biosynthesis/type III secretory pathway chaperone